MPIQLTYNFARDSSARQFGTTIREVIVKGRADGISGDDGISADAAHIAVMQALANDGRGQNTPHPYDPSMSLVESLFQGFTGSSIEFSLRYSTFMGEVSSSMVINISTDVETVEMQFYPNTRKPIFLGWDGNTTDPSPTAAIKKLPTIGRARFQRPIVRLSGTRLFYGLTTTNTLLTTSVVVGTVNSQPFLGRDPGAWLMWGYETSSNRTNGTIVVRQEARARGVGPTSYIDWREANVLYSDELGRYLPIDEEKFAAAISAPYNWGLIGGGPYDPKKDGFAIVGPYPPYDFGPLWSMLGVDGGDPPNGWDVTTF